MLRPIAQAVADRAAVGIRSVFRRFDGGKGILAGDGGGTRVLRALTLRVAAGARSAAQREVVPAGIEPALPT